MIEAKCFDQKRSCSSIRANATTSGAQMRPLSHFAAHGVETLLHPTSSLLLARASTRPRPGARKERQSRPSTGCPRLALQCANDRARVRHPAEDAALGRDHAQADLMEFGEIGAAAI